MSTFSSITTSNAYYNVYFQSLKYTIPITTQSCFKRRKRSSSIVSSSNEMMNKSMDELLVVSTISRRQVVNVLILTGFLLWDSLERFGMATSEVLELERYTDSVQGFTLLRPSSWNKVDKAGATALFQDANKGSNNVGVVVIPVKITTLSQFGDPQFVADKLILAEKRKESTKEAEVVAVSERTGEGGLQVYEFEYKVDSTRGGLKRILSAAFVASGKLYLLNIAHSDGLENPIDPDRRSTLEQILHSFDIAPSV
ncbi:PsbP domain-containing protein 2, chloroplastic [Capsicum chinense]|nr:PsbP domain-containing protein 2, chloroplastic [Capsicum chinense]